MIDILQLENGMGLKPGGKTTESGPAAPQGLILAFSSQSVNAATHLGMRNMVERISS
jgi:hypothetical protein